MEISDIKKEIDWKLKAIFPKSEIIFHTERSHNSEIDAKYVGIYFDRICMATEKIETLSWNNVWLSIVNKFEAMKEAVDNPDMLSGVFDKHSYIKNDL